MSRGIRRRQGTRSHDHALARLDQVERIIRQGSGGVSPKLNDGLSARLCYRNALHEYRGGLSLARSNEFGLARSVLILSIEELAKAIAYEMIYLGAFSTKRASRGHLAWFDRRCFKCHVCKHELMFRVKAGMELEDLLGELNVVKGLFRKAKSLHEVTQSMPSELAKLTGPTMQRAVAQSIKRHPKKWREIGKLFAEVRDMEHAKELGFYVEGWERPPTTPQQITREQFEDVRSFAEARLDEFFPLVAHEVPKDWRRMITELISAAGKVMSAAHPNYKFPDIVCIHTRQQPRR